MKNFPHQFNDLTKLTAALGVVRVINGTKQNLADDGVLGEALANAGIYTFRNLVTSVAERIVEEKQKPLGSQGFRTAARDIRRFFVLSGLIDPHGANFPLTAKGAELLDAAANTPLRNALWRDALLQLSLVDADGNSSHPYRLLLRLVADHPGIETGKLLLALEARDDSPEEYARISALAGMSTTNIINAIGVANANARNAVKILPGIAEQVGDIKRQNGRSYLRALLVTTEDSIFEKIDEAYEKTEALPPSPVNPDAIAKIPNFANSENAVFDLTAAIEMRKKRTIAHHRAVVRIAQLLAGDGFVTYENPYDCLGHKQARGSLLIEVKTLDGSLSDERRQSEKALGQLKGYNHFNVPQNMKAPTLIEMVAFSDAPTSSAIGFMRANNVHSAWLSGDQWLAADLDGNTVKLSPDGLFGP